MHTHREKTEHLLWLQEVQVHLDESFHRSNHQLHIHTSKNDLKATPKTGNGLVGFQSLRSGNGWNSFKPNTMPHSNIFKFTFGFVWFIDFCWSPVERSHTNCQPEVSGNTDNKNWKGQQSLKYLQIWTALLTDFCEGKLPDILPTVKQTAGLENVQLAGSSKWGSGKGDGGMMTQTTQKQTINHITVCRRSHGVR